VRTERGFSVVELLVAAAVLMTVCGAVLGLLYRGLAATPVLEETTDLHQRARVASAAFAADARAAAAGTADGPLTRLIAPAEPRGPLDPPGSTAGGVITFRHAVPRGAVGRLAQPLTPADTIAILEAAGCPTGTTACGFTAGSRALILDVAGLAAFITIDAIGPGTLAILDPPGGRAATLAAGAVVVEATEVTYTFDSPSRQLRRTEGGGTFVVADNVVDASFAFLGEGLRQLPPGAFQDGPFLGAGQLAFDADLRRVRVVRATLRLETGVDDMRGTDPRLFARPGTARGAFTIADVQAVVDVALRNVG